MIKPATLILATALAWWSGASAAIMTQDGLAPLKFGMTKHQVESVLKQKLKVNFDASGDEASCAQVPDPRDSHTWFMFENFRLVRIDTENPKMRTPEGATVGDTEARLRKLYGKRAVFSPHPYLEDEGHYVTISYPGRELIFETDHGRVASFRFGLTGPGGIHRRLCVRCHPR